MKCTDPDSHTHTLLGIFSAQLPASDEKSMARGETEKESRTKICKERNLLSLKVAREDSNYS